REQVDDYLSTLNRVAATVGGTADADVFFCGYRQLGDTERRTVSQQFRDICNALTPLAAWLVLGQEASAQDAPLTVGSPIRLNELQSIVGDTPAFREQPNHISHCALFRSTRSNVDAQIKQVFKKLGELGYLLRPNADDRMFL